MPHLFCSPGGVVTCSHTPVISSCFVCCKVCPLMAVTHRSLSVSYRTLSDTTSLLTVTLSKFLDPRRSLGRAPFGE